MNMVGEIGEKGVPYCLVSAMLGHGNFLGKGEVGGSKPPRSTSKSALPSLIKNVPSCSNVHEDDAMPTPGNSLPRPDEDTARRFWALVDRRAGGSACWMWTAATTKKGYGRFRMGGRLLLSHRVAYAIEHGGIPKGRGHHGMVVRHICDNPSCCNPAHLILGAQRDNVRDMWECGRAPPRPNRIPDPIRDQVRQSGLSLRAAARHFGITQGTVLRMRGEQATPERNPGNIGRT